MTFDISGECEALTRFIIFYVLNLVIEVSSKDVLGSDAKENAFPLGILELGVMIKCIHVNFVFSVMHNVLQLFETVCIFL